jgi:hypothetical protein
VFEVYLVASFVANVFYTPGNTTAWLIAQPIMFTCRVALLLELWWYATLKMLPRERWSVLAMCWWLGLAWMLAAWDVQISDLVRTVGHVRNRLNMGLIGMLVTGMLYLWSRPLPLHRNIPRHAWLLLAHLSVQCLTDAIWVRAALDRTSWFLAHTTMLLLNLLLLFAWGWFLDDWETISGRTSSEGSSQSRRAAR